MARRLGLMPVLPSVTVSEAANFAGSVCAAIASRMVLDESHAAPTPVAERVRNSRRCISPPTSVALRKEITPKKRYRGDRDDAAVVQFGTGGNDAAHNRCHPERGRRPGEGPYQVLAAAWPPAGTPRCARRRWTSSTAVTSEIVVRSLTRLRRVRDDKR